MTEEATVRPQKMQKSGGMTLNQKCMQCASPMNGSTVNSEVTFTSWCVDPATGVSTDAYPPKAMQAYRRMPLNARTATPLKGEGWGPEAISGIYTTSLCVSQKAYSECIHIPIDVITLYSNSCMTCEVLSGDNWHAVVSMHYAL